MKIEEFNNALEKIKVYTESLGLKVQDMNIDFGGGVVLWRVGNIVPKVTNINLTISMKVATEPK